MGAATPRVTRTGGALGAVVLMWAAMAWAREIRPSLPQYIRTVWTTEQGLPQNTINAILQTRTGYLWVGTNGGLTRFDGIRFTVFDTANTPELRSNRITTLYEDRSGALWIGTEQGNLSRYERGRFITYEHENELPKGMITCVAEDQAGALWVGTDQGLFQSHAGQSRIYTPAGGLLSEAVMVLLPDQEGTVWIGTRRGLARYRDGKFTSFAEMPGTTPRVLALHQSRDGTLWVGTTDGVVLFKNGAFHPYLMTDGRPFPAVRAVAEDDQGTIWIATVVGLFRRSRDGQQTHFTTQDGLTDDNVRRAFVDREGNLWIGTNVGGLSRWVRATTFTYSISDGLLSDVIRPVYQDRAGTVWLGTAGGLSQFKDGRFVAVQTKGGTPITEEAASLAEDREGNLWMGTFGKGLFQYRGGSVTNYTSLNSNLSGNQVYALYEDQRGRLWVGTERGLNRFEDGRFVVYTTANGLVHDDVRFITAGRQDDLWIGTVGGLSRWHEGQWTSYRTESGLSHNFVRAVHEDADGTLWIGTYGGGLNRLKDGKVTHYTTSTGLSDNFVCRMLEDDQGNFWLSGNHGIFRVSRKELNDFAEGKTRSVVSISYGVADGMKSSECNGGFQPAGWRMRDGRLWFPTLQGVAVVDPTRVNSLAPLVAVEAVLLENVPVDLLAMNELPPSPGNLEIHYTGLSFVAPHKVRFKYKLEGYDADWIDAGTRRVAYYTKIPPGRYQFRVIASNNDGVWTDTGATVAFRLKPHFYQTPYFYAAGAIGLILLGWGGNRVRVRQLERRNRELAAKVEARTAEVVEQKNQLAQANELLGRANENLLAVLNEFQAGVVTTDPEGRVTFLSQAAELLFNHSQDEALGQLWTQVFPLPEQDKARVRALMEQAPAQRVKLPVHIQMDSGRAYWMEIEVKDDPRHPRSKIFFFYDVSEVYGLRHLLDEKTRFYDLVGVSSAIRLVYKQVQDVARMDTTVLIEGETGTGKELVARAIHSASHRKEKPFVAVNCAGLTESLLASQLFGHKRGAFTGATADQVGVFEAAQGGTLFLDEIGEIPMSVQTSLLRVLQEKEVTRLGEATPRKIDVRILAATNRDLNQAVAKGTFRQDLLYRIRVGRIQLPPLRQRLDDVPLLVAWFLGQLRATTGKAALEVSREAMDVLLEYAWPGNVRELKSALEYAAIHCTGTVIQINDLPQEILGSAIPVPVPDEEEEEEKRRIVEALERAGGNRALAARRLGIGRTTLYRRMKALGIDAE